MPFKPPPTDQDTLILDIETYPNFFLVVMRRLRDGKTVMFELSERAPEFPCDRVRRLLTNNTVVTYNGRNYDLPVLWLAVSGKGNAALKKASDRIIKGQMKYWQVEDALGIQIPWSVKNNHIDLIEPQPNPFASLKTLNGRMHGAQMQDLPYDPDHALSHAEMDRVIAYCGNDIDATQALWERLAEPMDLRLFNSKSVGQDLRSLSDTQMGLAIIKARVEEKLGRRLGKTSPEVGITFRYKVPDYIRFRSAHLQEMLERIRSHDFFVQYNGKVELPDFLTAPIRLGDMDYAMGIGGLHSTEANRVVRSDDETVLVDWDVASYYPAIILGSGLYPEATGRAFLDVYRDIFNERLFAKKRAKELKTEIAALEKELAALEASDEQ